MQTILVSSRIVDYTEKEISDTQRVSKSASSLAQDISNYLNNVSEFSDFTLTCDDVRFPVHKAILAARSEVFAAMFRHGDTEEAATDQVNIVDTDAETLRSFLRYCCFKISLPREQLNDVLDTSSKKNIQFHILFLIWRLILSKTLFISKSIDTKLLKESVMHLASSTEGM